MSISRFILLAREFFLIGPSASGLVGGLNRTINRLEKHAAVEKEQGEVDLRVAAKRLSIQQKRANESSQALAVAANLRNLVRPAVDTPDA